MSGRSQWAEKPATPQTPERVGGPGKNRRQIATSSRQYTHTVDYINPQAMQPLLPKSAKSFMNRLASPKLRPTHAPLCRATKSSHRHIICPQSREESLQQLSKMIIHYRLSNQECESRPPLTRANTTTTCITKMNALSHAKSPRATRKA